MVFFRLGKELSVASLSLGDLQYVLKFLNSHQKFITVDREIPAGHLPGLNAETLNGWHKSQNTKNKIGGIAHEQNETYPRTADL